MCDSVNKFDCIYILITKVSKDWNVGYGLTLNSLSVQLQWVLYIYSKFMHTYYTYASYKYTSCIKRHRAAYLYA